MSILRSSRASQSKDCLNARKRHCKHCIILIGRAHIKYLFDFGICLFDIGPRIYCYLK